VWRVDRGRHLGLIDRRRGTRQPARNEAADRIAAFAGELPDRLGCVVYVHSNPNILGGLPCFAGTRVPVDTLFDHLRRGYSLEQYLAQFPTVAREHAEAVLELAARQIPGEALKAAG